MEAEEIQAKVRQNLYVYTSHGDIERQADGLTLTQTVYIPGLPNFINPTTRG